MSQPDQIQPDNTHDSQNPSSKPLILITGCGGLIGTAVSKELADDYHIVGMDLHRPQGPNSSFDWVHCDLTEDTSVAKAFDSVRENYGDKIESVIHLAAYYDFSGEPSPMYQKLTVEGTRRLLRHLREFQVGQFVFSSSLLVMEPANDDKRVLTETSPTMPQWDYPRSKVETEGVIDQEHGAIPVVILRLAGVYNDWCHSLPLSHQIQRIYEKTFESYFFPGDPDHGSPFLHVDDVAACVKQVVRKQRKLKPYEMFLIAEPDVMSHEMLQDVIGDLIHGCEWPTLRIPKLAAKAGAWAEEQLRGEEQFIKAWMIDLADDNYPVQINKARRTLDWNPKHRLHLELAKMIENLHRNPDQWYEENKLTKPAGGFPEFESTTAATGQHP